MNEEGKNIKKMIQQMTAFCEQVSLLLATSDDLIKKEGWDKYSNTVTSSISQHVQSPKYWIPNFLFRFYTNKNTPNILLFVSVLLDDDVDGEYSGLEGPLITAGIFNYRHDNKVLDNFDYYYAKWYGYYGDLRGLKVITSEPDWKMKLEKGEDYPFESFMCFALPLIEITNAKDINEKIIKPLLTAISAR
jgi:hypothetical protein